MSQSDTPLTDAIASGTFFDRVAVAKLSRRLERDRAALIEALNEMEQYATGVWCDEASMSDEEHELLAACRAALAKAQEPMP